MDKAKSCKDCTDRRVGCHATCEYGKAREREYEAKRQKRALEIKGSEILNCPCQSKRSRKKLMNLKKGYWGKW